VVRLHQGSVALPARSAQHASQGRLFQTRRAIYVQGLAAGLEQPRRTGFRCKALYIFSSGSREPSVPQVKS
jgi:hypothetical protein